MPDIHLQSYLSKIADMIRAGRQDEAVAHCRHILHIYPKHIATHCLLGQACLEMGRVSDAIECFQRTLSADPENLMARVGLGIIFGHQGALPEAIWQLERAFELAPGNAQVRSALQRFYTQRDGTEKPRLKLTQGALGRLYSRNNLFERANTEFRMVLRDDPGLPDIRVALAETLWREGRRREAVELCLELLVELPDCLKANLILGEIWMRGGNEEGSEEKLAVASALDPENLIAEEMMGRDSPLPTREVLIPELEAVPLVGLAEASPPLSPAEEEQAAEGATPHTLPDLGLEQAPKSLWALAQAGLLDETDVSTAMAQMTPEEVESLRAEPVPDWLQALLSEKGEMPALAEASVESAAIAPAVAVAGAAAGAPAAETGEIPEWLSELAATAAEAEAPAEALPVELEGVEVVKAAEATDLGPEEVPDWLSELAAAAATAEASGEPQVAAAEEVAGGTDLGPEEAPDWLRELAAAAAAAEVSAAAVSSEPQGATGEEAPRVPAQPAEEVPAWLRELGLVAEPSPSPDEAPEDLQTLGVAGILDQAGLFVTSAEITPEEIEALQSQAGPEWLETALAEEVEPPGEGAPLEDGTPAVADDIPTWLRELELPGVEEVPPAIVLAVETPAVEGMPTEAEEVPAWLRDLELSAPEQLPPAATLAAEPPSEETAPPSSPLDDLLRQSRVRPGDPAVRLQLARYYRDAQDWSAALIQYEELIGAHQAIPDVIRDLEPLLETDVDHVRLYQLLAEAYRQNGRTEDALSMYRRALQAVTRH